MSIALKCAGAIKKTGSWLKTVMDGQVKSVMATAQPVFSGEESSVNSYGYGSTRKYKLYICEGEVAGKLVQGDRIYINQSAYKIRRIEGIRFAGEVLYYKATADLVKEGEETWIV